jgi:hypothetical protein
MNVDWTGWPAALHTMGPRLGPTSANSSVTGIRVRVSLHFVELTHSEIGADHTAFNGFRRQLH